MKNPTLWNLQPEWIHIHILLIFAWHGLIFLEFDNTSGHFKDIAVQTAATCRDSVRNNVVIGIRIMKYSLVIGKSICLCDKQS